jgi:hypothetical protein
MGQQQLLLIILGTIIVAIAIAVGITMFKSSAVDSARDAVAFDVQSLGASAQRFYRMPRFMGGGERSFRKRDGTLIDIYGLTPQPANANGHYYVDAALSSSDTLVIIGKGHEVVGTDTVEVHAFVTNNNIRTVILH